MKRVRLRCDDEEGYKGIRILGDREWFIPSTQGYLLAHDLLEHSASVIVNPIVDEIAALGVVWWHREMDIANDLWELVADGSKVPECPIRHRVHRELLEERVDQAYEILREEIAGGYHYNRYEDEEFFPIPPPKHRIVDWMGYGIQNAKRRYRVDDYGMRWRFTNLEEEADRLIRCMVNWEEYYLYIDMRAGRFYWEDIGWSY